MRCGRILRWLLGIWLVETVAARHILNGEDTGNSQQSHRLGRDQFHPFYQKQPHLNYNSFRSSLRRTPPQVPGRRNLAEQEVTNGQQFYNNYFTNDHHAQNQQNNNVYSAVRLHGALEARARNEPGSNTLLPTTQHFNYYHPQQDTWRPVQPERHFRRDDEPVDGESYERDSPDDLARFSLYNSYFDNEHSIKALNSMKCVTPTGSPGFCSTFRGCVPSFFTKDGELEAPALAELISTSIGFCTTNVSHHFIREQRQHDLASSREERRFDSVANRIICCPGTAPERDPNQDPDKIFNDYIENQKQKTTTTTTAPASEASENAINGPAESTASVPGNQESSVSQLPQETDQDTPVEENVVNDGQASSNQEGSQPVNDAQQAAQPSEQGQSSSNQKPEQASSTDSMMYPAMGTEPSQQEQGSSPGEMMYPTEGVGASQQDQGSTPAQMMYPTEGSDIQKDQGSTSGPMMYPSTEIDSQRVQDSTPGQMMSNEGAENQQDEGVTSDQMMYPPEGVENQQDQGSTSGQMMYPTEGTENVPSVENSSQTQQNEGSPLESSSSPSIPEQSTSTPEQVSSGNEETSQQPIQPIETEAPSTPDAQPPSNDESEESSASAAVESTSPPGSQETSPGKLPPKTQDSNIIKIYPEPVSGVNGKFTLPGGIYIVSTSTDTPNNNKLKPVHPSAGEQVVGGGETIVGSKPIIIVSSPGESMLPSLDGMPAMPNFPSDFPPMGSQESPVPPVDDSSLELLQRPRPQAPVTDNSPSSPPAMSYPSTTSTELPQTTVISSASTIANDGQQQIISETTTGNYMQYPSGQSEGQSTTNIPQQDENFGAETTQRIVSSGSQQQDESEIPTTTVLPAQQQPVDQQFASGDSNSSSSVITPTTNEPPLSDDDDEGNDAFTIIPINQNPSEKTSGSTTTETIDVAAGVSEVAATTVKSQPVDAADQESQTVTVTTISSVSGDGVQESGSINTQSPAIVSGSQDTGIETTTIFEKKQQQITTLLPGSDESDESSEELAATKAPGGEEEDDIQKTTVSPGASSDFIAPTTISSVQVETNHDDSAPSGQDEEALPASTSSANVQQPAEGTTTAPAVSSQHEQDIVSQGGIMYPPGSESMVSEMRYPTSVAPGIILNPGSEVVESGEQNERIPGDSGAIPSNQQHDDSNHDQVSETLQPFPATSPGTPGEAGTEQQQLFPGSETSADQSQMESESTRSPTTISDQEQSFPASESSSSEAESTTSAVSTGFTDNKQQSDAGNGQPVEGSESGTTSQSSSTTNDGDTTWLPTTSSPTIIGIQQDGISGSDTSNDGGSTFAPGNEQPSFDGANTNNEPSPVSSTGGEPIDTTSQPAGVSGSESLPTGGESSSQGSEPIASGTESPNSGNDSSISGASDQADEPISSGSESPVPESATHSPSSQLPDTSNQSSESSVSSASEPVSSPESIPTEQPTSVPSNDEPTQSADDSDDSDNQSFVSSTSVPSTGRPVETESISQDHVPSVSSTATEDASPVQGSTPEADSTVPSDIMQDSQPVISTSEVPQDVSSPASVASSSMYPPSTAAAADPTLAPENILPNYQILKACKFQNFFRSVNDMAYSYRHYPWLATIVGGTRPFSSGTLITDRHILTASHFLANITVSDVFNMRIHIGYRTSYSGQTEGPYAVRKVRKVIRHKGFSFEKLYNDIAVLVLDRPVRFSEDIYPVCISSNRTAYSDGTAEAFETGWIEDPRTYTISQHHNYIDPHIQKYFSFGYKNITWRLQEAPQRVRTNTECQSNYSFLEKNGIMVTDSMVCAGSGDTRSCAFRGNSGAPLFLRNENDKMTEQIGIVSFGIGCGHFPFVFTRVESFLPWLDRVVYNSR